MYLSTAELGVYSEHLGGDTLFGCCSAEPFLLWKNRKLYIKSQFQSHELYLRGFSLIYRQILGRTVEEGDRREQVSKDETHKRSSYNNKTSV